MKNLTEPTQAKSLQSPQKQNDPRLAESVQQISVDEMASKSPGYAVLGYPDSEGIARNLGRQGAEQAPDQIRSFFYKLCSRNQLPPIYDVGNIPLKGTLEDRHEDAIQVASEGLNAGHRMICLGGGHDYAYPDGTAFLKTFAKDSVKPLIVNIDAHLDVRSSQPKRHSGSPFYQLLEENSNFDLVEFGIQAQANSEYHLEYTKNKNVTVITFEDRHLALDKIRQFNVREKKRPLYLSVDIDGFSSSIAPGASAAWPLGLLWSDVEAVLKHLVHHHDLKMIGVYEVSPPLDQNDITSKLASSILYQMMSF